MRRSTALRRARAGAAFLDQHFGSPAWRRRVARTRLRMVNGYYARTPGTNGEGKCGCILAQLDARTNRHGSYHRMADRLNLTSRQLQTLGFTIAGDPIDFDVLDDAWKEVLAS